MIMCLIYVRSISILIYVVDLQIFHSIFFHLFAPIVSMTKMDLRKHRMELQGQYIEAMLLLSMCSICEEKEWFTLQNTFGILHQAGIEPATRIFLPPYILKLVKPLTRIVSPGAATLSTQAMHDFVVGSHPENGKRG